MPVRTACLSAALLVGVAIAQPTAQAPPLTAVMNEKADNAQHLLRPLVTADLR